MADERPSLESLIQRRRTLDGVYAGTFWRHNDSGDIYMINSIGIRESDYRAIVHYSPTTYPDMEWDRELEGDFLALVGADDMPRPRFSRVFPKVTYGDA